MFLNGVFYSFVLWNPVEPSFLTKASFYFFSVGNCLESSYSDKNQTMLASFFLNVLIKCHHDCYGCSLAPPPKTHVLQECCLADSALGSGKNFRGNPVGRNEFLRACPWGFILCQPLLLCLLSGHNEVIRFPLPHASQCLITRPKTTRLSNHRVKTLESWAKINFSSI